MGYAMRTRRYRYIAWVNFTNIVVSDQHMPPPPPPPQVTPDF